MAKEQTPAAARRRGAPTSASGAALMDAVEAVMREDGYGALTARRVAQRAGLNYQLVFYHFGSMDELLLAAYRRHLSRYREAAEQAAQADRPLHAYWSTSSKPEDAVLNMEFIALANHNETIRAETLLAAAEIREINLKHIAPALQSVNSQVGVTPAAMVMVLNYVGSLLSVESALGINGAHSEIRTLMGWCIDQLEPPA